MQAVTVVIVDDQEIARSTVADLLDVVGGFRVVGSAATGEDGLAVTLRTRPELVVMDVRLPGMSGPEATRRIRDLPGPPAVVLISTDADALHPAALLACGALQGRAKDELDPGWAEALREEVRRSSGPR